MAGFFRDQFEAALQHAERAGARQLAFGKQADHVALFQRLDDFPDRLQRLVAPDGQGIEDPGERPDGGRCHEDLVHHKADGPRTGGGDKKRVGIGHVVRQ